MIRPHKVISIVGNAKNAGKTTVLNAIIRLCRQDSLAITSIGLDGELIDNVTALPKPRIFAYAGMWVATAEECLKAAEALLEVVADTGIATPLGSVKIVRVLKEGNVLVAGPSTVLGMNRLVESLKKRQTGKILIDGAFSRKSLMRSSDACIFAIGAVKSPIMEDVVATAKLAIRQFNLPKAPAELAFLKDWETLAVIDDQGAFTPLSMDSAASDPESLFDFLTGNAKYLYLPGSLGPLFAKEWIRHRKGRLPDLILQSPAHLVLPDPMLDLLFQMKTKILVLHPVRLVGVAYNPYSPTGYVFDEDVFREKLSEITDLPLFNVMHESEEEHEQTRS